uniref:Uncharacterized protein n=1 Tax=Sphaerodactylus townsendi TaxID=933632 RepID=A0ACB8GAX3_9SAUR
MRSGCRVRFGSGFMQRFKSWERRSGKRRPSCGRGEAARLVAAAPSRMAPGEAGVLEVSRVLKGDCGIPSC